MWPVWALLLVSPVLGAEEFLQGDDAEGLERHLDDLRVLTRGPACGGGLRPIADGVPPRSTPTPPTRCIENPLFRPAGPSFVVHRLATP